MADLATQKLYVDLSASQVRKLLKGHGLGVRRVEAVGRHKSLVVHTATGQHRRDLETLLKGVNQQVVRQPAGTPVNELRNIGPVSSGWLQAIGIKTRGDLERCGPVHAYRLVKQKFSRASLNLLWAMAAALQNKDWRDLPARERKRLLAELKED